VEIALLVEIKTRGDGFDLRVKAENKLFPVLEDRVRSCVFQQWLVTPFSRSAVVSIREASRSRELGLYGLEK
jgi:hypothetical protein